MFLESSTVVYFVTSVFDQSSYTAKLRVVPFVSCVKYLCLRSLETDFPIPF